jgi:hypothetical protein
MEKTATNGIAVSAVEKKDLGDSRYLNKKESMLLGFRMDALGKKPLNPCNEITEDVKDLLQTFSTLLKTIENKDCEKFPRIEELKEKILKTTDGITKYISEILEKKEPLEEELYGFLKGFTETKNNLILLTELKRRLDGYLNEVKILQDCIEKCEKKVIGITYTIQEVNNVGIYHVKVKVKNDEIQTIQKIQKLICEIARECFSDGN